MRKSIILYTLLCAVSSGVSVAHAAVYDQVTQEYALTEPIEIIHLILRQHHHTLCLDPEMLF